MSVDNLQYVLNWNNYTANLKEAFDSLLKAKEFVDVTLSCEGKKISAHQLLLSACSTYFHDLFRDNPCQHPIVIFRDVKFQDLEYLLTFMYTGEVSVRTEHLDSLLKTAELLHVSGLRGNRSRPMNAENEHGESHNEAELSQHTRPLLKRHAQTAQERAETAIDGRIGNNNTSEENPSKRLKLEVDSTINTEIKREQVEVLKRKPEELPLDDNPNTSEENPAIITEIKYEQVEGFKTEPEELPLDDSLCIDTETFVVPADSKAENISPFTLSKNVKTKHMEEYKAFINWKKQKKISCVNEEALLEYLGVLGKKCNRAAQSIRYSRLKAVLNEFEHVDITKFPLLLKYHHKENRSTKTLGRGHVKEFLLKAPDHQYLLAKIVLILAVAGCRCVEVYNLKLQDVIDEGSFLGIKLSCAKGMRARKFVITNEKFAVNVLDIFKKYMSLRPSNVRHKKFFLSYKNSRCSIHPITVAEISKIPKQIATYLNFDNLSVRFKTFFKSVVKQFQLMHSKERKHGNVEL